MKQGKNEAYVSVTTSIPLRIRNEAKTLGVTIQSLVIQGWENRHGFQTMKDNQADFDRKVAKMSEIIASQQARLWSLEENAKKEAKR